MIKAVIFDMYETLVTAFGTKPYYSQKMAEDLGVDTEEFRKYWRSYESDRTLGKCNLDETLRGTLSSLGIYTPGLLEMLIDKRLADQKRIFSDIDPRIVKMLGDLRAAGVKTGLLSNCYFEERDHIRASVFGSCFDAMILSCEQGLKKPDHRIFLRCLEALEISAEEALYVGDGGSSELEAASAAGMRAVQACWFLKDDEPDQPCKVKDGFEHAFSPEDIIMYIKNERL